MSSNMKTGRYRRVYIYKIVLFALISASFLALSLFGGILLFLAVGGAISLLLPVADLLSTYKIPLSVMASVLVFSQLLYWEKDAPEHILQQVRAKEISKEEFPELHSAVQIAAKQASTPTPKIHISNRESPMSLATGFFPSRSHIVLSRGLIEAVEEEELYAVVAHEISHIKNRDVAILTAVALPINAAKRTIRLLSGKTEVDRGVINRAKPIDIFFLLGFVLIFPIGIGMQFFVTSFSRLRELTADRGAVAITGNPAALSAALNKINERHEQIPTKDLRETFESSFSILDEKSTRYDASWKNMLFSTHPPLSKRIEYIQEQIRERQY